MADACASLFLLLAQSHPHGVQTGRQRGDLIAAADGNGVIQIAALHGLDLLTELDDIFHNAAAGKPEHHQKQPTQKTISNLLNRTHQLSTTLQNSAYLPSGPSENWTG